MAVLVVVPAGFGAASEVESISGYPANSTLSALPWPVNATTGTENFSIVGIQAHGPVSESYVAVGARVPGTLNALNSTVFFTYTMTVGNFSADCNLGNGGLPNANDCTYDVTGGTWAMFFDATGFGTGGAVQLAQLTINR